MSTLLAVHELVKRFGGNYAVDGATFDVERGSITGMIGPNGAGKTTCFNCIAGSLMPDGGRVVFEGKDITGLPSYRVFRRGLTRTFQIPQELGAMTVLENLMVVPAGQAGERVVDSWLRPWRVAAQERAIAERAHEVLAEVDLTHEAQNYAGNLSGGQRKLLELARALMSSPSMILLDEPSAGVNPTLTRRLVDHIRGLRDRFGITFFVIAHDMDFMMRLCERLIVMADGQVLVDGEPQAVLEDTEVQAAYLGTVTR
jgi:branched-chain amino acid transport system ATP-binding protein